jgi:hypothetical protein
MGTSGPKVKIADENMAIASFKAPKVSSVRDKLTLKFVLLITSDSGNDGRNSINKMIIKIGDSYREAGPIVGPQCGITVFNG